jgi:hypothetical protein
MASTASASKDGVVRRRGRSSGSRNVAPVGTDFITALFLGAIKPLACRPGMGQSIRGRPFLLASTSPGFSADSGLIYIESSGPKDFEVEMRSVDVARRCSLANAYKRRNKVDRIHLLHVYWRDVSASQCAQSICSQLGVVSSEATDRVGLPAGCLHDGRNSCALFATEHREHLSLL